MNENKENKEKNIEYNTPIPTTNFNGTPNLNALHNKSDNKKKVLERRVTQPNIWHSLSRNGYIGLQILIIIITLATILGIIIGSTIYVYTK